MGLWDGEPHKLCSVRKEVKDKESGTSMTVTGSWEGERHCEPYCLTACNESKNDGFVICK